MVVWRPTGGALLLQQPDITSRLLCFASFDDFCNLRGVSIGMAVACTSPRALELRMVGQCHRMDVFLCSRRDAGAGALGGLLILCATLVEKLVAHRVVQLLALVPRLRELRLDIARVEFDIPAFRQALGHCVELRRLELRSPRCCTPRSELGAASVAVLLRLPKLRMLALQGQLAHLSPVGWATLQRWVAGAPRVASLELSGHDIPTSVLELLPRLQSLICLNLACNLWTFHGKGALLSRLLSSCPQLSSFRVALNGLRSSDAEQLCVGLRKASRLQSLDVSHNLIFQWGAAQLLSTLRDRSETAAPLHVDLRYNAIDEPPLIAQLHALRSRQIDVDVRHCEDPDGEGRDLEEILNEERSRA